MKYKEYRSAKTRPNFQYIWLRMLMTAEDSNDRPVVVTVACSNPPSSLHLSVFASSGSVPAGVLILVDNPQPSSATQHEIEDKCVQLPRIA